MELAFFVGVGGVWVCRCGGGGKGKEGKSRRRGKENRQGVII